MVEYKNIRIKMANGKTRLQRVQVLASGKYKFVKNLVKGTKAIVSRRRSTGSRSVTKTGGNRKALRVYGATGGLEDIAWGWIGFNVLGRTPAALPATRVVQGLAGYALDRRGKGRAVYGILDLVALWLSGALGGGGGGRGGNLQSIFNDLQQIVKIRPLAA